MSFSPYLAGYSIILVAASIAGVCWCGRIAFRCRNFGMLLFTLYFAIYGGSNILALVFQTIEANAFESEQLSSNSWTAHVITMDLAVPLSLSLILIACFFVGRGLVPRGNEMSMANENC